MKKTEISLQNCRERIYSRRKELKITLKELAEKAGITEATMQRYESGKIKTIPYDKLTIIANVLEMSPAELLGWTDDEVWDKESDVFLEELNKDREILFKFLKKRCSPDINTEIACQIVLMLLALDNNGLNTLMDIVEIMIKMNTDGQTALLDSAKGLSYLPKYQQPYIGNEADMLSSVSQAALVEFDDSTPVMVNFEVNTLDSKIIIQPTRMTLGELKKKHPDIYKAKKFVVLK